MTISRVTNSVQHEAAGNDGEKFNIPFPFDNNSEIILQEADVTQVQGTIYTVSGAGTSDGGTATYASGQTPVASALIDIQRVIALDQDVPLQETGRFSAKAVENALDKLTMIGQQSLTMDTTTGKTFDAKAGGSVNRRIVNLEDGTAAQDAVTLTQLQSQTFEAGGTLPTPISGTDDDKHIEAQSGAYVLATHRELPTTVSDDVDKICVATGADTYEMQQAPAWGGRAVNLLMNGNFAVAQHGTAFTDSTTPANDNDTYLLDRWVLLSEANDSVDVDQELSIIPDGGFAACKFTVTATANDKFGIVQILETRDSLRAFDGASGTVSVSVTARTTSGNLSNYRVGILAWTGSADAPTSNVVSAWNAQGTNPTLVTSWDGGGPASDGYQNTPADIALTNTYVTTTIEAVALDTSGTENIAVFIWCDDGDAGTTAEDVMYIADVQLEIGDRASPVFGHRPYAEELALCQRYLQVYVAGDADDPFCMGANTTDTENSHFIMPFVRQMRATPTLVVGSAATDFEVLGQDGSDTASAVAISTATPSAATLAVVHTTVTAGSGLLLQAVNANAKLTFVAEL